MYNLSKWEPPFLLLLYVIIPWSGGYLGIMWSCHLALYDEPAAPNKGLISKSKNFRGLISKTTQKCRRPKEQFLENGKLLLYPIFNMEFPLTITYYFKFIFRVFTDLPLYPYKL